MTTPDRTPRLDPGPDPGGSTTIPLSVSAADHRRRSCTPDWPRKSWARPYTWTTWTPWTPPPYGTCWPTPARPGGSTARSRTT